MYNIDHLKKEFKEFESEFYDYKNVFLNMNEKIENVIKMNFYINVLDFFEFYTETVNLYNEKVAKVKILEMFKKWYLEEEYNILNNEVEFNDYMIKYLEEL